MQHRHTKTVKETQSNVQGSEVILENNSACIVQVTKLLGDMKNMFVYITGFDFILQIF
jgi:hypothetical protein